MPTVCRFLLSIALAALAAPSVAQALDAAVAANLRYAFEDIAAAFTADTGIGVRAAYGASGKLFAQIRQAAPFHVFLAADTEYPQRLFDEGHALAPPRVYALGSLVVWTRQDLDPAQWPALVGHDAVRRIALPNPRTAPYGRAALQALAYYGVAPAAAAKLVVGESVAQASQFVASGNAELGFTARSVVLAAKLPSPVRWQEVAPQAYAPIEQAAVLLRHGAPQERAAAQRLLDYLAAPPARAVLAAHGYRLP